MRRRCRSFALSYIVYAQLKLELVVLAGLILVPDVFMAGYFKKQNARCTNV